jgi:hypothetical protein
MAELGQASWSQKGTSVVAEGEGFDVYRRGKRTLLSVESAWKPAMLKAAREHKINCLDLGAVAMSRGPSLELLAELPSLRELHVVVSVATDLRPIATLKELRYLGLMGELMPAAAAKSSKAAVLADFSLLKKLEQAYVELCPASESILACAGVQSLWLWNRDYRESRQIDFARLTKLTDLHVTAFPKLAELDLSNQPALQRFHLEALPKLKVVKLHPRARLRALKVGGCGVFRIDWNRMADDLDELELSGPLRFPMEDILRAKNLRIFRTNSIRTFPPLKFLLKLPKLQEFGMWATPPGPKWSEDDWEVYRQINSRRREGTATASA